MRDNIKHANIWIKEEPEEYSGKSAEKYKDSMNAMFPNLIKTFSLNIQKTQQTPSKITSNIALPRHFLFTLMKLKDEKKFFEGIKRKIAH